jgi:uncharacterized protein (DUF1697 family)
MPRYVALLRGVSPMNCRMPELKACFEAAGFGNVRTVLSSGNVVFDARASALPALERRAERAMHDALGRSFPTIVRSAEQLGALVASDPFAGFALPASAKRVVTFLRNPEAVAERGIVLPVERDGTRILRIVAGEAFTAYEPNPKAGAFMALLERTFGKDVTTRTLATVEKCANA